MNDKTLELVWAIYFSGLVAMERHPGKAKEGNKASIQQLAHMADVMLLEHKERWEK